MYVFATNSLYFQFAVWSQSTRQRRCWANVYINCVIIIMFCGSWFVFTDWLPFDFSGFSGILLKNSSLWEYALLLIFSLSLSSPLVVAPGLGMAFELAWI